MNGLRLGLEADHYPALGKKLAIPGVNDGSAPGGDDKALLGADLFQHLTLQLPKSLFTVLGEDFRDAFSGTGSDLVIAIHETPPQTPCHLLPYP